MLTRREFVFGAGATLLTALIAFDYGGLPMSIPISGCAPTENDCVQMVGVSSPIINLGSVIAPIIGIQPSTPAQNGYMSAADKAKLDAATDAATPLTLAMRAADGTVSGGNAVQLQDFVTLSQLNSAALRVGEIDGAPNVFPVSEIRVSNGVLTDLGGGVVSVAIPTAWSLRVREADGAPNVSPVTEIVVSNGTLTDLGGGAVGITTGGGGGGAGWGLSGNAGTNPLLNFVGTTDNQNFVIKVNSVHAMRFEPRAAVISPAIIGGFFLNSIDGANYGSAILSGGNGINPNSIGADSFYSVMCGGAGNAIGSGRGAFIGGGELNSNLAEYGLIVGGTGNSIQAAAGGGLIVGGYGNLLTNGAETSAIVGGDGNTINNAAFAFIGSGESNSVSGDRSIVGGGASNSATSTHVFIGGGFANVASAIYSVIAGGYDSRASGDYSFVGGGETQIASGRHCVICGGASHEIIAGTFDSAIVGGDSQYITGSYDFVGGGAGNRIDGAFSAIAGGSSNLITGSYSYIGGGESNSVTGAWSVVSGGKNNTVAGDYSVGLGLRAKVAAGHPGTFMFADAINFDYNSTSANEFDVRATGGVNLVSGHDGAGNPVYGLRLRPDGHMRVGLYGAPATSAVLDIDSTDGAVLLPRMTTAQRNALTALNGMLIYNTTDNEVQAYKAGAWANL